MMSKFPLNIYYPRGFNHDYTIEQLYLSYVNDFITIDAWKNHYCLTSRMVKIIFQQCVPREGME